VVLEKPPEPSGGALIPEGFGTVTVRLTQGAARTTMPGIDLKASYLKYFFTKDGGTPEEKTAENEKFSLEPGSYSLTVEVYADAAKQNLVARGTTDQDFTISAGVDAEPVDLFLHPVSGTGTGKLEFSLTYPKGAEVETFTLTPIDGDGGKGTPTNLASLGTASVTDPVVLSGTQSAILAGYYLLQVALKNSYGISTGQVEVVHIYQNLTATVGYVFTKDDFPAYQITSAADSGPGSLRQILEDVLALPGGAPQTIALAPGAEIELESPLPEITKSLTIEGNGATLTMAASWTGDVGTQLLRITDSDADVVIRRLHFKNGQAYEDNGGAISNSGILTLESCVFSGNTATGRSSPGGGAVYSSNSTLTIRGCTFYGNSAASGGAVLLDGTNVLTMTGNLFYRNTSPVLGESGSTVTAFYNVVDVDFSTASWTAGTGGKTYTFTGDPIDLDTFAPNAGSPGIVEIGIVPGNLAGFPETDFYGNVRTFPGGKGAAGAVNYQ
jgi:predicted outer membrane repeat protein